MTEERQAGEDEVGMVLARKESDTEKERCFRSCPFRAGRPHKPGRGLIFTFERTRLEPSGIEDSFDFN